LVPHGGNFNFAIWYLELRGISNPDVVKNCLTQWINVSLKSFRTFFFFITLTPAQFENSTAKTSSTVSV